MRDLRRWIKEWIWEWQVARLHRHLLLATADAEIAFLRRWKEC